MTKKTKRMICIITVLILSLSSAVPAYAGGYWETVPESKVDLYTAPKYLEMGMWHYSGGYWKAGIGGIYDFQISDAQLGEAMNIDDYINANCMVDIPIPLTSEIVKMMDEGYSYSIAIGNETLKVGDLLDKSKGFYASPDGNIMHFYAYPKLCFSSYTYDDFISGLGVTIPLISEEYGYNNYAIFSGSSEQGPGIGAFFEKDPSMIISPNIHPQMIKSSAGYFSDGYKININGKSYQSSGYRVGYGTFAAGGAVGLYFIYQFYLHLTFTVPESTRWVETADKPASPGTAPENPALPSSPEDEKSSPASGKTAVFPIHRVL